MAKNKCKRKPNQGGKPDTAVSILIIAAIVALIWFVAGYQDKVGTDIGTDIDAIVDDGLCTSREGIEMGLCCAVWNTELGDIEWVLCENIASPVDPTSQAQAFFRFEDAPNELNNVALIAYFINIENTGNADAEFRFSSITTTSIPTSVAQSSRDEFTNAFASFLPQTWQSVEAGESVPFQMTACDGPRLDLPLGSAVCGLSAFQVEDGEYYTTVTIEYRDPLTSAIIGTESRQIKQEVTQEVISFSIDIST